MADIPETLRVALAGRYAIDRELGSGGMAVVYAARDLKHHRAVAIKEVRPEVAAVFGASRFLREFGISASLQHPHVLTLIDSGDAAGMLDYVMPLVEGESLRERLRRCGRLGITDTARILRDVLDALSYAHEQGVVHRDQAREHHALGSTRIRHGFRHREGSECRHANRLHHVRRRDGRGDRDWNAGVQVRRTRPPTSHGRTTAGASASPLVLMM